MFWSTRRISLAIAHSIQSFTVHACFPLQKGKKAYFDALKKALEFNLNAFDFQSIFLHFFKNEANH